MKYRVSNQQALLAYFIIMSLSFGVPNLLIRDLGQDFWQVILIALVMEVILGWFMFQMGMKFKGQTIFQYSERILGKFLSKISNVLFSLFFMLIAFTALKVLSGFLGSVIMPETPTYVFALVLLLVSTYATYTGIEVIMRLSGLIAPFVLVSSLFIFLLNIKKMDTWNLRPMFQHNFVEVVHGTVLPAAWFGSCIIMSVIMGYQNEPQAALKSKLLGVGSGICLFCLNVLAVIMAIGVEVSSWQLYSVFFLAQIAEAGGFIERMEAFQVVAWTAGCFFITALFHYAAAEGFHEVFSKRSRTSLSCGIAVILFVASVFAYPSSQGNTSFLKEVFSVYALGFEVGSVTLLYLIFKVKGRIQRFRK